MAYLNRIEIIGNLCGNVELKQNANGKAYSSIRVAVTVKYGTSTKTYYYGCSIYRNIGGLTNFLTKGSTVYVNGELSTSIYNGQNGSPQISHDIMVDNIQLLVYKEPQNAQQPQQGYAPQQSGYVQNGYGNRQNAQAQQPQQQQTQMGIPFPPDPSIPF